jgi:hypothetical protein
VYRTDELPGPIATIELLSATERLSLVPSEKTEVSSTPADELCLGVSKIAELNAAAELESDGLPVEDVAATTKELLTAAARELLVEDDIDEELLLGVVDPAVVEEDEEVGVADELELLLYKH